MAQTEHIDPTGFGLLLVAAVSLPGAIDTLLNASESTMTWANSSIASVIGTLLLVVALLAYKANSNFGMTVFGVVGAGVLCVGGGSFLFGTITGTGTNVAAGSGALLVFTIIYAFCIVWSIVAKTPKLLTALLVTTTLIFLFAFITTLYEAADLPKAVLYLLGISYLANFVFNAWLGAGLCCDKIPTF